ncbi:MAG: UPF0164 family protein [Treponema sp.]|nr:UPF0164 family protein [Treponema sp.]
MKKKIKNLRFFIFYVIFSVFLQGNAFSLSYSDLQSSLLDNEFFQLFFNSNEGTSSFRSLLIPVGGRSESLASSYTGLFDDISFINYNAAASSIQKETQVAIFHNSWIADSALETISYTSRNKNLGYAAQLSCFHVPFTEYNAFGKKVNASYYSETVANLNLSYNFLAGYDFKGIAVGCSFKTAWRGMPDYTEKDTDTIIYHSGLQQSALGLMADVGIAMQFNLLKNLFYSREPNVKIGLSAQNLGVALTGFSSPSGVKLDDPLPTYFAFGFSCKFVPVITLSFDIKQPVNLIDFSEKQKMSISSGIILDFTDSFCVLAGLELKGGNPRISLGSEFDVKKVKMNVNYTLDLTTSFNPINRISFSAKLLLGDKGRSLEQEQIDLLYASGLMYYNKSQWQEAINEWEKILEIDKRYDPAIKGIKSAKTQLDIYNDVYENMFLSL